MSKTCEMRIVALLLILCCCRGTLGPPSTDVADQDQPASDNLQASSEGQRGEAASVPRERIHPDVYTKLKQSDDGRVYVSIMLKPEGHAPAKTDRIKSFIKKVQDKVLDLMGPGEFESGYRYETVAMLTGYAKAEGLAKFAADPNVSSVKPSKVIPSVHAELRRAAKGRIYVIIRLRPAKREGSSEEENGDARKQSQDTVVKRFAPGEFQLFYRYDSSPTITGMITPGGLAMAENIQGVVSIRLDGSGGPGGN